MGKKITILIFLGLVLPLLIFAVEIKPPLKAKTFGELINNIVSFIFNVVLIVMPLIIVIAGAYYMFSGGDPEQIKKARELLYYTGIGFIIILLAKGVIALLEKTLIK